MRNLSFLLILFSIPVFAQIGAKTQQNKIHGIWQNNAFGYQMTLMLNADGTGELDGEAFKYTAKDNKLTMTIIAESQTIVYNYNLQGNSLTVSGGDMEAPVTFSRSGTSTEQPVTNPATTKTQQTNSSADKNLIGLWSGNNETIEFTTDGKCNYIGQTYPYQVSNGNVTLQTAQGNFMMAYSVKGNQLSLTVNGQTIQYTKGANTSQNTAATSGGKRVAQELVGKWCYVEKRNHPKNNDPMIVLDGTTYVTYYQKEPWR